MQSTPSNQFGWVVASKTMKLILLVLALILIPGDIDGLKSKLFQSTKDQKFDGIPLRVINGNQILCAVRAWTSNNFSAKNIFIFRVFA